VSTAALPEASGTRQEGKLPGVLPNTPARPVGSTPRDRRIPLSCVSPGSPQQARPSDRLNLHKSLQYKVLSSSTDSALDLDPTLRCKTSCLRADRLASPKQPHSPPGTQQRCSWEGLPCKQRVLLRSNISPFHVAPLLLAHPRWAWEDDRRFGEAGNHPVGPHVAFCNFLPMSACCSFLFGFLHRLDSLASPNYFLTGVGLFCYLKQSSTTACTCQPNLATAEHPNP